MGNRRDRLIQANWRIFSLPVSRQLSSKQCMGAMVNHFPTVLVLINNHEIFILLIYLCLAGLEKGDRTEETLVCDRPLPTRLSSIRPFAKVDRHLSGEVFVY
jgi:hypothetical protein